MKIVYNQQGYALLAVLLLIVLVVGFSATFIAGSMNVATQEQTVDTSNQSVAAAEMGVLYHTANFEEELKNVRKEVAVKSQELLNGLKTCIRSESRVGCNTDSERSDREDEIDAQLRAYYLEQIKLHAQNYSADQAIEKKPFNDLAYALNSVEVKEITDPNKLQIDFLIQGKSDEIENDLRTTLTIEIPEKFIVKSETQHDPIIINQVNNEVTYGDIFDLVKPEMSCKDLKIAISSSTPPSSGECSADSDESMRDFSELLIAKGLDPKNFTVYTENFIANFCKENNNDKHCRDIDLKKLNIISPQTSITVDNHMRLFSNFKLIVNGQLETGNHWEMVGLGNSRQTIILKELFIGNHLNQIENTSLLVLGYELRSDATLDIKGKVEIGQNSKLCLDIDRIKESDWKDIAEKVVFFGNGSLSFYSKDPSKKFPISGSHIYRASSYESFLESCGYVIETTESIPIAVPVLINTGFDFEVDYAS